MNEISFNEIAYSYKPFKILKIFKLVGVNSFLMQNIIVALGFCIAMLIASFLDNSFILPNEDIGLFEHPSIWIFVVIQIVLPFSQSKALKKLVRIPQWDDQLIENKFFSIRFDEIKHSALEDFTLKSFKSRSIFRLIVFLGIIAFIWNSYQNQLPQKFVGFDFWDSINNPYGYWISRIYKLYLWCLLIPFCLHLQFILSINIINVLREASNANKIDLDTFGKNTAGGFNQFMIQIINPIVPLLFIAGLHAIFVIIIHNNLHLTPLIGIILFCVILSMFYFFPVLSIRKIIIREKNKRIRVINKKQNELLKKMDLKNETHKISDLSELLKTLSYIADKHNEISDWAGLHYVVKLIGLAYSPALLIFILKNALPFLL